MIKKLNIEKSFALGNRLLSSAPLPPPVRNPTLPPLKPFINNEFVDNISDEKIITFSPIDGKPLAEIQHSDETTVERAVAAAKAAFDPRSPWRKMEASERAKLMWKLADLLERDAGYMASLDVIECGKIYTTTLVWDVLAGIRSLRYFSTLAWSGGGLTVPIDGDYLASTYREPSGVAATIASWNFPAHLALVKSAPALAAGCTVVMKPSQISSLSNLHFAKLVAEAGFPPGVVNVVPGKTSIGQTLSSHPDVNVVSVTASTNAGIDVYRRSAPTIKRLLLNLGAKSPFIVLADAASDIKAAATLAQSAIMSNMGQCCVAGSRTYVHESIYDEFVEKSIQLTKSRVIGDPFHPKTQHGPQCTEVQLNCILDYIEKAQKEGAKLECGGKRIDRPGTWMEPAVFTGVEDHHTICKEEVFGPVQLILPFKTLDEVVERANNTEYGLAAGICSNNLDEVNMLSKALRAGIIWVNCYLNISCQVPFGGFKLSGVNRETGIEGYNAFTDVKSVMMKLPRLYK